MLRTIVMFDPKTCEDKNRFQILALGWIKFLLTTMWLLVTKVDMAESTRNTKEMNE